MTRMVADPALQAKLAGLEETMELCDESGRVIGHFIPAVDSSKHPGMQPRISKEELDCREARGGGRPLRDILADLDQRA